MATLPSPTPQPLPPPPLAIPARLAVVLRRAHAAELTSVGDQRRPAFGLTRALLGGARRAGYSTTLLADCLGLSISSVQARSGSDGWITADTITHLADLAPATVEQWHANGLLPTATLDQAGQPYYLASELIPALTQEPTD